MGNVILRAATERGWLRIEVDDDGPGIPADERENVFKPFTDYLSKVSPEWKQKVGVATLNTSEGARSLDLLDKAMDVKPMMIQPSATG